MGAAYTVLPSPRRRGDLGCFRIVQLQRHFEMMGGLALAVVAT